MNSTTELTHAGTTNKIVLVATEEEDVGRRFLEV